MPRTKAESAVLGWRAWYTDVYVFSSDKTQWVHLPDVGIVLVMLYFDKYTDAGKQYRAMQGGSDWYWPHEHSLSSHSEKGKWLSPPEGIDSALLKRGLWVSDAEYAHVQEVAMASTCP